MSLTHKRAPVTEPQGKVQISA